MTTLDAGVPSDAPVEVVEAYIFKNGMVMAFDVWGKQVADYQGAPGRGARAD